MRRHKIAIFVAVLALAGVGAGAYAATQATSNPQQAFLNDVAKRLHVSPAQLSAAVKGAMLDRLAAAVKSGHLTQPQANAIRQQLESGRFPLGLGEPFGFGPRLRFGPRLGFGLRLGPGGFGGGPLGGVLGAAASYLGLTPPQLIQQLQSGKTPAQIAAARHKSIAGLTQAIASSLRARLDQAVTTGLISKAQEQRLLSRLESRLGELLEHGMSGPNRRFFGPRGLPAPGPAGFGPVGPAALSGPPGLS